MINNVPSTHQGHGESQLCNAILRQHNVSLATELTNVMGSKACHNVFLSILIVLYGMNIKKMYN